MVTRGLRFLALAAVPFCGLILTSMDARAQGAPPLPDEDEEVPAARALPPPRPAAPPPPVAAPPPPPAVVAPPRFAVPPPLPPAPPVINDGPQRFAVPPPLLPPVPTVRVLVPPPPPTPWWHRRHPLGRKKRPRDQGRVYVNASFVRLWNKDQGGFLDRARTHTGLGPSYGGLFEVGVEMYPRLSLVASYNYQHAGTHPGEGFQGLTSDALLAHLRYAVWRRYSYNYRSMAQLQLSAGTGAWRLDGNTASAVHRSTSSGFRGGADLGFYCGVVGLVFGYGWTYAPAFISDSAGGRVEAGGHEVTIGLSLRL
jgi:hypothetical protein